MIGIFGMTFLNYQMATRKLIGKIKEFILGLADSSSTNALNDAEECKILTTVPGIGEKNCKVFYDAGYRTPESVIKANDEELMEIPGVGIGFVKRLRKNVNKI
tara:strand:- start:1214 stop:1522 length:309 start_codon:yes stop_codon:yes gene_type:complete